jgi:hypothetical protein
MNTDSVIRRICNLPRDFRTGDSSAYELVRASGIKQRKLTIESVLPVLRSNPTLVEDWVVWSEDQRCTPAYYFLEENGQYVVGRHPDESQVEFDDRFVACADFIVKAVNLIW